MTAAWGRPDKGSGDTAGVANLRCLNRHHPATAHETLKQAQVCLGRGGVAPLVPHGIFQWLPALKLVILETEKLIERMVAMSRLSEAIRSRRDIARTRRELNRAIANAATPAMRDELILVAQRGRNVL